MRALVDLSTVRRGSAVLCACVVAACVTPLGPALFTEVSSMVERIRAIQIQEWQPTSVTDPWNLPFWLSAVVGPWLAWRRRRDLSTADAVVIGGGIALTVLGVRTTRNVMPALLLIAPGLSRLAFPRSTGRIRPRPERAWLNKTIAVSASLLMAVYVGSAWVAPPRG